jgi:hypothetical protein
MPPPQQPQSTPNKALVVLALSAIKNNTVQSARRAAAAYSVPRSTLSHRHAGRTARRDCQPNSRKLTKQEEKVLVRHILNLDARGFAPTLAAVRDMANRLLAEKGASQVGKIWPYNFVKRTLELKTRFTRQQDC